MLIQHQTKLHNPEKGIRGNCMMTSYACYFNLDVNQVPNIEDLFDCQPEGFWFEVLELWLREYHHKEERYHEQDPYLNGYSDYYFASGPSPRGVFHRVIYKEGKLFHDPHPSGAGILEVRNYITLEDIP